MADTWNEIWTAVQEELSLPAAGDLTRACVRLLLAMLLAALLGYDRERKNSSAGLRTHMLVALGTTLLVIASQQSGMDSADMSRVLQGIAAGIGFLGAGAIIKLSEKEQVKGLTTAAGIWSTAAISIAAGLGHEFIAVTAAVFALVILALLPRVERMIDRERVEVLRDDAGPRDPASK